MIRRKSHHLDNIKWWIGKKTDFRVHKVLTSYSAKTVIFFSPRRRKLIKGGCGTDRQAETALKLKRAVKIAWEGRQGNECLRLNTGKQRSLVLFCKHEQQPLLCNTTGGVDLTCLSCGCQLPFDLSHLPSTRMFVQNLCSQS